MKAGPVDIKFKKEDVVPFDMKGVWQAMEECCKLGLAKSIGVSNFSCTKLSHLLQIATIPPAVNQVSIIDGVSIFSYLAYTTSSVSF